jgi:hypothetical protein
MVELYLHSSIRFHGVVINQLSSGETLPFTVYNQWISGTSAKQSSVKLKP